MQGRLRIYAVTIMVLFTVLLTRTEVFAFTGSGSGTESNPYLITTPAQIQEMGSNLAAYYKLGNDIDMAGIDHVPIGTQSYPFRGTFDGAGYKIKNLTISKPTTDYVGLFTTANEAVFKNIALVDVAITGRGYVGSLAGACSGSSIKTKVENCSVSGNITGSENYVGGLIGYVLSKTPVLVYKSYSTAIVKATAAKLGYGGLIGRLEGYLEIKESYFSGEVSGATTAGGLVGHVYNGSGSSFLAENCYSIGTISATYTAGGLASSGAAISAFNIINSYSANILNSDTGSSNNLQGLLGSGAKLYTNSYFDGQRAGDINNPCSRLTNDMMSQNSYVNWDFDTIWTIDEGSSYPYLKDLPAPESISDVPSELFVEGEGTEANPYILTNSTHIKIMGCNLEAHYKLGADIDMVGISHIPIGNSQLPFKGSLNGDGYKITNLSVNDSMITSNVGLFGYTRGAWFKNIILENVNIKGSYYVGALAGTLEVGAMNSNPAMIVENCSVTGTVSADSYLGGILGNVTGTSKVKQISKVSMNGTVTSPYTAGVIGGIAGSLYGSVEFHDSYFVGDIICDSPKVGLVAGGASSPANNKYTVSNCYSIAKTSYNLFENSTNAFVGSGLTTKQNSYYHLTDLNTANAYDNNYPEFRTMEALKQSTTFNNWAFNDVWCMEEGVSAPIHRWMLGSLDISGLIVSKQELTALSFSWDEVNEADSYEVKLNDGEVSVINENSILYEDLEMDTEYTFSARVKKSNVYGEWVSITTTTLSSEMQGSGTELDPYIISIPEHIQQISNKLNAHYKLANDIDMIGINHEPIGNSGSNVFRGSLDGDNYKIVNLTITQPEGYYVGLFGRVDSATVKNLSLVEVNIDTRESVNSSLKVGGLIGYVYNNNVQSIVSIENCMITGNIRTNNGATGGMIGEHQTGQLEIKSGSSNVNLEGGSFSGGLIGSCHGYAEINESYFNGTITGTASTGGLIGVSGSYKIFIENSFSLGSVTTTATSSFQAGGLCGASNSNNDIELINSYSACKLIGANKVGLSKNSISTNSFFDSSQAGVLSPTTQARSTGLMKQPACYVGWDFDNIWHIETGISYPVLRCFFETNERSGLLCVEATNTSLSFTWDEVEDAESYEVRLDEELSTISNNSITYNELESDTEYTFGVRVITETGYGQWETIVVSTLSFEITGNGTESEPYIIYSPQHLESMRLQLSAHYKLGKNIDMAGVEFEPIGTQANPFKGTLDGAGYTIKNLTINLPESNYVGLFGYTNMRSIRNLLLEDVDITGKAQVGALAGYISNAQSSAAEVFIESCGVTGAINSKGEVSGSLFGYANNCIINNSYSAARITSLYPSKYNYTGGLAGYLTGNSRVQSSYFSGEIHSEGNVYGFAYCPSGNLAIENSFTIGKLITDKESVGIVGTSIINSYSANEHINNVSGNKAGIKSYSVQNSYFDNQKAGILNAQHSKVTAAMTNAETFENWDFEEVWQIEEGISYPYIRNLPKPNAIDVLLDEQNTILGLGTIDNPYILTHSSHIQVMANILDGHFALGNDIDMNEVPHTPIGSSTNPFTGSLDGRGHKIENLVVSGQGFFWSIDGASIKNLELANINVSGYSRVGGLVGSLWNSLPNHNPVIENCKISGSVIGSEYVGGLVGHVMENNPVIISNVYSSVNFVMNGSGRYYGGIIGGVWGACEINESVYAGNMSGWLDSSGGLVGTHSSSSGLLEINNCYVSGELKNLGAANYYSLKSVLGSSSNFTKVTNTYISAKLSYSNTMSNIIYANEIVSSYFDSNIMGKTTPIEQARTTVQMKQQATYTNWDFDNTWYIEEGVSYPQLRWLMDYIPEAETVEVTGLDCSEISSTRLKFSWNTLDNAVYEAVLNDGETSTITANSIIYTNLIPFTEYTFKVRVKVGSRYSEWLTLAASTDPTPIDAPATVTLVTATATSLEITWMAVEGATAYDVNVDGETVRSEETNITLENLAPLTAYAVKVKAVSETNQSDYSPEFRFTTLNIPAPSGLKFDNKGHTSATLSWSSAEGAESYEISFNSNTAFSTSNSVELTGLIHETTYAIKVRGIYGETKGDWSSAILVTTDTYTLEIPTNLIDTAKTSDSIEISWSSVAEAESYVISYGNLEMTSDGTTAIITGLNQYTDYAIKVKAVNQYTESFYCEAITVRTEPAPLDEPSGLIYTSKTYTSVALSWNPVASATEYEITYGEETISATSNNIVVDGLLPDTEYVFNVMAKNSYTTSPQAEITVRTELPSLGIPANLIYTDVKQESISLSWESVAGADEYIITYNSTQKTVVSNSTVISNLLPNTDYSITIQAKNQYVTGAMSDSITVKTLVAPVGSITGLKVTDRQANSITLAWDAVSGAENYEVKYGQNTISTTDSSIVITNLAADTTYTFSARAISTESTSPWSNSLSVKTLKQNSVMQNETVLQITASKNYDIVFTGKNIQNFTDKVFEIRYDATALQLIDFAAQTTAYNTAIGNVSGTDLQIVSVGNGVIQFKVNKTVTDNKAWSGMFTIVKFKALKTGSTSVFFEQ